MSHAVSDKLSASVHRCNNSWFSQNPCVFGSKKNNYRRKVLCELGCHFSLSRCIHLRHTAHWMKIKIRVYWYLEIMGITYRNKEQHSLAIQLTWLQCNTFRYNRSLTFFTIIKDKLFKKFTWNLYLQVIYICIYRAGKNVILRPKKFHNTFHGW